MLHITNGDSAANLIRTCGFSGTVLPWIDVLHEGPVLAGLPLDELRIVRARFIADAGWETFESAARRFAERDAALRTFVDHDEVLLWFEHDLYDQLQLIQLLDFFSRQDLSGVRLTVACEEVYLGAASVDRLRALFDRRHDVSAEELDLGRKAWLAFGSSDPTDVVEFSKEPSAVLPFLPAAFRRHLEQFPSVVDGLSRSERQALEAIADGAASPADAFAASQRREERLFLGDTVFGWYLAGLSPLVTFENGEPVALLQSAPGSDFRGRRLALSEEGRGVLAGEQDRVSLIGIERWLGGIHLSGRNIAWRWDPAAQQLRSV